MRGYVLTEKGSASWHDVPVPGIGPYEALTRVTTRSSLLNDYFGSDAALAPVDPIPWNPEWIFRMAVEFELDRTSHFRTHGVHSAYLATLEETLYVREDIGRHNAFDKVIGSALIHGVDLAKCLLFTSGRVPIDMVTKAIRARLPILVSKAAATAKTVEVARACNLTLICSATSESFDVLSGVSTSRE